MTQIVKGASVAGRAKPCVATVRMAAGNTRTKGWRLEVAKRRGLPPAMCGAKSAYEIDGRPLCLNHAGQQALRILMGVES